MNGPTQSLFTNAPEVECWMTGYSLQVYTGMYSMFKYGPCSNLDGLDVVWGAINPESFDYV
jgi:hypothetical protein